MCKMLTLAFRNASASSAWVLGELEAVVDCVPVARWLYNEVAAVLRARPATASLTCRAA